MFALCCKIKIGDSSFTSVREIHISRSIYKIAATAVLKLPVTAMLKQEGEPSTKVETAKQIAVGDQVEIELGYNRAYHLEFKGFVRNINYATPLEIECEDYYYPLRSRSVSLQGKTTLEEVLQKCSLAIGYTAKINISSFQVDNKPVASVLAKLKTDYGVHIFFDLLGNVYATEPAKVVGGQVKYKLRENVIKDDSLKFRRAADVKLKIKAICFYKDGEEVEASIGVDGGETKTLHFYDVESENELALLADAELKRHSYDGYEGTIETFLFPFAEPTMVAQVVDDVYKERDGKYYIDSVEVRFSTSGARRKVSLGLKM